MMKKGGAKRVGLGPSGPCAALGRALTGRWGVCRDPPVIAKGPSCFLPVGSPWGWDGGINTHRGPPWILCPRLVCILLILPPKRVRDFVCPKSPPTPLPLLTRLTHNKTHLLEVGAHLNRRNNQPPNNPSIFHTAHHRRCSLSSPFISAAPFACLV
jgi:hypothetical protein